LVAALDAISWRICGKSHHFFSELLVFAIARHQ
jgi:hypothetical protein